MASVRIGIFGSLVSRHCRSNMCLHFPRANEKERMDGHSIWPSQQNCIRFRRTVVRERAISVAIWVYSLSLKAYTND